MASKKSVVGTYLSSNSPATRPAMLACLTDDIEWRIVTSGELTRGKADFEKSFSAPPGIDVRIDVGRLTEEGPTVIAEATAHISKDGVETTTFEFVDIFDFAGEKIRHITTFWGPEKTVPG